MESKKIKTLRDLVEAAEAQYLSLDWPLALVLEDSDGVMEIMEFTVEQGATARGKATIQLEPVDQPLV